MAGHLLLRFTASDEFVIDTPLQQLVVATFGRSQSSYRGILSLLLDELPTQAAMLARSLFEDVVVAHWLVFNREDPDWLIQRFHDHRDAMALYQSTLAGETGWRMGEPIVDHPERLKARQNELGKVFKGEARRDWWDPGERGKGSGNPVGLREASLGFSKTLRPAMRSFTRASPAAMSPCFDGWNSSFTSTSAKCCITRP
jgi:hypothetical protein